MRQIVVDRPAPGTERCERWSDIEDMIRCLQELGWRMEKFTQTDEDGEPLRVFLRFRYDQPTVIGEIL